MPLMNHNLEIAHMNQGMASLAQAPPMSIARTPQFHSKGLQLLKASKVPHLVSIHRIHITRQSPICCTKLPPREPSNNFLEKRSELFGTLRSEDIVEDTTNQALANGKFLKLPMWVLGPSLLLVTGMVPALWLPVSTIFIGPYVVSLLSLIGLDCIFNLGATVFLLMADYCAQLMNLRQVSKSNPPSSYQLYNTVSALAGFMVPLMFLFGSQRGYLQPQLPFIQFAVLLGPYILLLLVQVLTEMFTWHWQSPVWLVTPVVYEAYRVLQLMRGLRLGVELNAPEWMMHSIRGLVCWWVLVLGVQLMWVAWFVGFTARARRHHGSASVDG